jgi:nucleoside-triphosphatase THEP1
VADPARAAILTGPRGSGKTTLCLNLSTGRPYAGRQYSGRTYAGVACPAIYDTEGRKLGFACKCLATGITSDLGRTDRDLGGPRIGKYSLSADGIRGALSCLEVSLSERAVVTVVDEIGPLELRRGDGLSPLLPKLHDAGDLLLVVRDELIHALAAYIPEHFRRIFTLSVDNRTQLAAEIADFFG